MLVHSATDLGLLIRDRRKRLGLDQRTLAERVGVSRQWIVAVEKGKASAEVGLVMRTLRALDLELDARVADYDAGPSRVEDRVVSLDRLIDRAKERRR
jgi:HTH-type transcriptional regulator/antitoxin HipB